MMHPLYKDALYNLETDKMENKKSEPEPEKTVIEVNKDVELTDQQKIELKLIMEDSYSRGSWTGMITNIYFNHVQTDKPLGADTIIQQALMVSLLAKKMAGMLPKPKPKTTEEDLCVEQEKPKIKLVM